MITKLLALVFAASVVLFAAPVAGASGGQGLQIEGTIGNEDIALADSTNPIKLDPHEQVPVHLTITNPGTETEEIRHLRLEGKALGLTFLTYDLGVKAVLGPGQRTVVDTKLDFFDLGSQATGFLGTALRVYDPAGHVIGQESFVVDVRGKANSTLGLFAMVILGMGVFSTLVLVINTIRRRLPPNRFVRAMQFALAGAAIGVTLSLGVSVLRIGFADVDKWVPIVVIPTMIAFALGYLAPGPLQRSIRDFQAEEALQTAAHVAIARASGLSDAAVSSRLRALQQSGKISGRVSHRVSGRLSGDQQVQKAKQAKETQEASTKSSQSSG